MQLVIPTHGRVHKQITLRALPPSLRREVLLITSSEDEAEQLRAAIKPQGVSARNVRVAPVNTITDKRQWILENVKSDVFMLDDDMVFYRRCDFHLRVYTQRWKPKDPSKHKGLSLDYVTESELEHLFTNLASRLADVPLVGISSRFGNDLEPTEERIGANRLMHAFGYRRRELKKFSFNDVDFREDFHLALSMYRRGHASYQIYEWCVAPGAYGAPGGCTKERTVSASDAAAVRLAELHPGYVKVVYKNYKGTPRKEVIVQWKKALEHGRRVV